MLDPTFETNVNCFSSIIPSTSNRTFEVLSEYQRRITQQFEREFESITRLALVARRLTRQTEHLVEVEVQ